MQKIYLDSNATTKIDPLVISAMLNELEAPPSNPSSQHFLGREAKSRLMQAREIIASYCKVKPKEIIFTSSGTEGLNLLIQGFFRSPGPCHVISSNIEHASLEKPLLDLQSKGVDVTFLQVGHSGKVPLDAVINAITPHTKLLAFSSVNGETGVKQDLEGLSQIALKYQIPLFIDGVALLGKEQLEIPLGVTAMAFSAHKFHGPKGVGFIFLRSSTKIRPLLLGGGQEYGFRSGTENLPGIIGLAKAIELIKEISPSIKELKNYFEKNLIDTFPFIEINGGSVERVSNVSNLAFIGIDGETLLIQLDLHGILASHGSACSSGALEPSRILTQMGLPANRVKSSIRFSLSRFTTKEEIDYTLAILTKLIPNLKK